MPNLRGKTWTPTTPAKTEDANFWEDHLIDDESYEGLQNLLEGGGAGHEIQDADGNTMPQQPVIQFINAEVTNGDGKTIVSGNGQRGPKGDPGDGVPSGGTAGQYLQKTATGTAWAEVDALPDGGTAGQVLTKTATGAEWATPAGGDVQSVNSVTPDTNGNVAIDAGDVPISVSGISATDTESAVGEVYGVAVTHYYAATLGAASATSDSTVYSGGYKLTISNSTITANSTAVIFFPSGDYSGNVTWITGAGKVDLYFDQNPNGKAIRVEWKTLTYTAATIS